MATIFALVSQVLSSYLKLKKVSYRYEIASADFAIFSKIQRINIAIGIILIMTVMCVAAEIKLLALGTVTLIVLLVFIIAISIKRKEMLFKNFLLNLFFPLLPIPLYTLIFKWTMLNQNKISNNTDLTFGKTVVIIVVVFFCFFFRGDVFLCYQRYK